MYKKTVISVLLISSLAACAVSPTGRRQFLIVGEGQMSQMGAQAYAQMKTKQKLSSSLQANTYVRCIANAITRELGGNQQSQWEVNVFENASPNAFALPGKKIGVNTGMITLAQSQDQLAAVMGHEVGHVLARHSAERMSLDTATKTGTQLLQVVSGESTPAKQKVFGLLGLGAQYGVKLPFSRKHESEADIIGVELMAKAGFDPRGSVQLWQNMAKASKGSSPEFMSTHPSNNTRINQLNGHMSKAMSLYRQAQAQGKKPQCG